MRRELLSEVVAERIDGGLGAAVYAELEIQVGDVALHGARAEKQCPGDPAIAVARRVKDHKYLPLA